MGRPVWARGHGRVDAQQLERPPILQRKITPDTAFVHRAVREQDRSRAATLKDSEHEAIGTIVRSQREKEETVTRWVGG